MFYAIDAWSNATAYPRSQQLNPAGEAVQEVSDRGARGNPERARALALPLSFDTC